MKEGYRYLISFVILLFLWWLVSFIVGQFVTGPKSTRLPGPISAIDAIIQNWSQLGNHFTISAVRLAISLLISTALGASLGLIIGFEEGLKENLSPFIYLLYPLPKVVFLPLILVLIGINNVSRIVFIILVVMFQVLLSSRDAAKNISRDWVTVIESSGGSHWQVYRHVVIPASLPSILSSVRISIGLGIAALYLAETTYANQGLGYYIRSTWKIFSYPEVFAGILSMGLLGLGFYIIIDILERVLCRWQNP